MSRLAGRRRRGRKIWFSSTQGGRGQEGASSTFGPGHGQIWVLDAAIMSLSLVYEAPEAPRSITVDNQLPLSLPDTSAISPKGAMVLCEDGTIDRPDRGVVKPHNYVRGLSRDGELFDFAKSLINDSELTGACFSPVGASMFVTIRGPGATYEIRGPWGIGPW